MAQALYTRVILLPKTSKRFSHSNFQVAEKDFLQVCQLLHQKSFPTSSQNKVRHHFSRLKKSQTSKVPYQFIAIEALYFFIP